MQKGGNEMQRATPEEIVASYQRFYKYRIDKGMTDTEVCQKADVGRGVLSNWRNGKQMPTIKSLYKFAQVVGANVSDFIGEMSVMI